MGLGKVQREHQGWSTCASQVWARETQGSREVTAEKAVEQCTGWEVKIHQVDGGRGQEKAEGTLYAEALNP